MSIENAKIIDFVSLNSVQDTILLTISDHLGWSDDLKHQFLLQEKLNSYLAFIESGEMLNKFPDAKDKKIQIQVVFKYQPDLYGSQFLDNVRVTIEAAGFYFTYQVGIDKNND